MTEWREDWPCTRHQPGPTAADVLGVPFLPSGPVTLSANRARSALGRIHSAMAPPPVRILEGQFGMLERRVLVALCEAGVPDAVTGPVEVVALADRLGADPPCSNGYSASPRPAGGCASTVAAAYGRPA